MITRKLEREKVEARNKGRGMAAFKYYLSLGFFSIALAHYPLRTEQRSSYEFGAIPEARSGFALASRRRQRVSAPPIPPMRRKECARKRRAAGHSVERETNGRVATAVQTQVEQETRHESTYSQSTFPPPKKERQGRRRWQKAKRACESVGKVRP